MSGRVHLAQLKEARPLAPDVVEYEFVLPPAAADEGPPRWRPGQFISVTCGHQPDGEPLLRSYSIGNLPGEGRILLLLKLVAGGAASAWFRALPVGATVRFTGPMGFFVLELSHPGDLVFAATGTGIAPIVPMIAEAIARGEPGHIHLYWGLREPADLFWQDRVDALVRSAAGRMSSTISLSRPDEDWRGARGRINPHLLALAPSLTRPTFYLCGNGAMIREVKAALVARGVDRKRQIRTEAFFD